MSYVTKLMKNITRYKNHPSSFLPVTVVLSLLLLLCITTLNSTHILCRIGEEKRSKDPPPAAPRAVPKLSETSSPSSSTSSSLLPPSAFFSSLSLPTTLAPYSLRNIGNTIGNVIDKVFASSARSPEEVLSSAIPSRVAGECNVGQEYIITSIQDLQNNLGNIECIFSAGITPNKNTVPYGFSKVTILTVANTAYYNRLMDKKYEGDYIRNVTCADGGRYNALYMLFDNRKVGYAICDAHKIKFYDAISLGEKYTLGDGRGIECVFTRDFYTFCLTSFKSPFNINSTLALHEIEEQIEKRIKKEEEKKEKKITEEEKEKEKEKGEERSTLFDDVFIESPYVYDYADVQQKGTNITAKKNEDTLHEGEYEPLERLVNLTVFNYTEYEEDKYVQSIWPFDHTVSLGRIVGVDKEDGGVITLFKAFVFSGRSPSTAYIYATKNFDKKYMESYNKETVSKIIVPQPVNTAAYDYGNKEILTDIEKIREGLLANDGTEVDLHTQDNVWSAIKSEWRNFSVNLYETWPRIPKPSLEYLKTGHTSTTTKKPISYEHSSFFSLVIATLAAIRSLKFLTFDRLLMKLGETPATPYDPPLRTEIANATFSSINYAKDSWEDLFAAILNETSSFSDTVSYSAGNTTTSNNTSTSTMSTPGTLDVPYSQLIERESSYAKKETKETEEEKEDNIKCLGESLANPEIIEDEGDGNTQIIQPVEITRETTNEEEQNKMMECATKSGGEGRQATEEISNFTKNNENMQRNKGRETGENGEDEETSHAVKNDFVTEANEIKNVTNIKKTGEHTLGSIYNNNNNNNANKMMPLPASIKKIMSARATPLPPPPPPPSPAVLKYSRQGAGLLLSALKPLASLTEYNALWHAQDEFDARLDVVKKKGREHMRIHQV